MSLSMERAGTSAHRGSGTETGAAITGGLLGGLAGLPLVALSYLGAQWVNFSFFPFDLFDWISRILPGDIIRLSIGSMVKVITGLGLGPISSTAKWIEQLLSVLLMVGICIVLGAAIGFVVRRSSRPGRLIGIAAGFLLFAVMVVAEIFLANSTVSNPQSAFQSVLNIIWLAILVLGWGGIVGSLLIPAASNETADSTASNVTASDYSASRRSFLAKVAGGAVALTVVAWGGGRLFAKEGRPSGSGEALANLSNPTPEAASTQAAPTVAAAPVAPVATAGATMPAVPTTVPASARIAAAPGTRDELTANKDFYRIDIDLESPAIDKDNWTLEIKGLFDKPRTLKYADLLAFPAVTQPVTMSCISNPVGGDLISTSNWTGLRLRDLLMSLGLNPEAKELTVRSADSFYENVVMADMMDERTLLVYGMNGETLPKDHGFPLRIYIPNRYGMKQPKWITSIEAVKEHDAGYWVERGWSDEARPQIVSVIDAIAKDQIQDGKVPVGGIAWAGARGIQKVEVQVDGDPWVEATLRVPSLGPLTWVQWRYDWPVQKGHHAFAVRATDKTGALQIAEVRDPEPEGATGYDFADVTI